MFIGSFSAPTALEGSAFVRLSGGEYDYPDVQLLMLNSLLNFDGGVVSKAISGYNQTQLKQYYQNTEFKQGFTVQPGVLRPKSRGSIQLRSKNPKDHPIITLNYLKEKEDLDLMVKGQLIKNYKVT